MPHIATCHCKMTRIVLPHIPDQATACTCTFCTKKGVLWGYFNPDSVVIDAAENDQVYAPSGINRHHFCGTCGCATYAQTPDWSVTVAEGDSPAMRLAVNLCLLDACDARTLPVQWLDGRNAW